MHLVKGETASVKLGEVAQILPRGYRKVVLVVGEKEVRCPVLSSGLIPFTTTTLGTDTHAFLCPHLTAPQTDPDSSPVLALLADARAPGPEEPDARDRSHPVADARCSSGGAADGHQVVGAGWGGGAGGEGRDAEAVEGYERCEDGAAG